MRQTSIRAPHASATRVSPGRRARRAALAPLAVALAIGGGARADVALPAPTDRSAERWCAAGLDGAVATARRGALEGARDALLALAPECTGLPQVEHDLGVLAWRLGDEDGAVRHLERALEADARVARTVEALREVRRFRAARAWADALGEPRAERAPPRLELLDSSVAGATARLERARDALLRDEAVVGYELHAWWDALAHGDADDVAAHYASDAARLVPDGATGGATGAAPAWDEIDSEIAFTARDAVAVLRWPGATGTAGRILLLRAVDDRWLIYRESAL